MRDVIDACSYNEDYNEEFEISLFFYFYIRRNEF